jgi:hypothetical protein
LPLSHIVPVLIANAGEQAGWRYIVLAVKNSHPQPAYAPCLCPRVRTVLHLVRGTRPDADHEGTADRDRGGICLGNDEHPRRATPT